MAQDILRLTTAGSVDDGKSTLIGRLLFEAGVLYEDHLASLREDSRKLKREGVDLSLVTDGLKAEREQGITIDVAYRYFSTPARHFIIADTPGHEQYTRNMATGASTADLALILVDARNGMTEQSCRHAFIASLLGIRHVAVVVNKMDLAGYREDAFLKVRQAFEAFAGRLAISDLVFIPVSALQGDNVVRRSDRMPWFRGLTLLDYLQDVRVFDHNLVDLRFPVQMVLRPSDGQRVYAGRVISGAVHRGDEVMVLPSCRKTRVRSIIGMDGPLIDAFAPRSTALTLEDECDVSRGDMIVHSENLPRIVRETEAILVWLDREALSDDREYFVKHTTRLVRARASRMHFKIDPVTLSRRGAGSLGLNDIGRVSLRFFSPIFVDEYLKNRRNGSFIMIDPATNRTVAAGMIIERGVDRVPVRPQEGEDLLKRREELLGQRSVTVWMTGLSGAGKSTVALALEKQLLRSGYLCRILDGDDLRTGLNKDLGFSPEARQENIRRTAEVARLLNEAGLIVIVALISPYRKDRLNARKIIGADRFQEVYLDTALEVCEKRDPKGLYRKARSGDLPDFTGISAPYESPEAPDIVLKSGQDNVSVCVGRLWDHLRVRGFLGPVPEEGGRDAR